MPISCRFLLNTTFHFTGAVLTGLILMMNIYVITLFIRTRSLRKTTGNYILISLSMNDLLSGINIIMHFIPNLYLYSEVCTVEVYKRQKMFSKLAYVAFYATEMLMIISVSHLVLLSADRLLLIFRALRYSVIMTRRRVAIILSCIWLFGIVLTLSHTRCPLYNGPCDRSFTLILFLVFLSVPIIFLSVEYTLVFLLAKSVMKRIRGVEAKKKFGTEFKVTRLYFAMFVSYILTNVPWLYFRTLLTFNLTSQFIKLQKNHYIEAAFLLRYLICLTNPLLYVLYKKDFRSAAIKSTLSFWKHKVSIATISNTQL